MAQQPNYTVEGAKSTQSTGGNTTTVKSTNMDPASLEALQTLIAQLLTGGSPQQQVQQAQRATDANTIRADRAGYSKENAFADAQGAMAQQQRQVLEQILPALVRASEGAGTSQNSMRALLLQDAATRAAEAASAQGLQASTQYGQIGAGLAGVLEALTRPDNSNTEALLNALQIAKGSQTTSTTEGPTSNSVVSGSTSGGSRPSASASYQSPSIFTPQMQQAGYSPLASTPPLIGSLTDLSNQAWSMLMGSTGSADGKELYDNTGGGKYWDGYTF